MFVIFIILSKFLNEMVQLTAMVGSLLNLFAFIIQVNNGNHIKTNKVLKDLQSSLDSISQDDYVTSVEKYSEL